MKDLDWRILKELYEKKSITQAAGSLYITQSALTKRLKNIENEWDIKVAKRTSKGIIFTEDGVYLAQKALIMIDFLEEISEHFEVKRGAKEIVRIGVPNSFARLHMPKLLKGYMVELMKTSMEVYDALQFKTIANSSDIVIKQLIDGSIDMGIVCGDFNYLGEKILLFDEAMYMILPKGRHLSDVEHMPVIESYWNPVVKSTVDQWWRKYFGSESLNIHKVPYSEIAIEMVENRLGCSFVFGDKWPFDPERADMVPIYDANGNPVRRNVWLMLSDQSFKSKTIMDFVEYVKEYYHL